MIPQAMGKTDDTLGVNEEASFEEVYSTYGARVFRLCHRLCANSADAEDLAQEVFVAAFRGLPRFAGRAALPTWLYQIALNRWRTMRRKKRVDEISLDRLDPAISDPSETRLREITIDQAMAKLPAIQREAILLVKGEGLTCREAARVLRVPEGTVKFRVYQGLQRLRVLLDSDTGSDREVGHEKR